MGKIKISAIKTGFKFNLVAGNGEIIGTSQVYKSMDAAKKGAESVKNVAHDANTEDQTQENYKKEVNPKFEIYKDNAGEFRFRLNAKNGENILASEGYTKKDSCLKGIESVKKNAATSEIVNE